jgi:DNA-binding MarR family transcriptional regulator
MTRVAAQPAVRDLTAVEAVADNFVDLMRAFQRARARLLQATAHDVEWAQHNLLRALKNEGPMRAGALAEAVHSDPSTISRQVAALIRDELVERRADPEDGRASILALTAKADGVLADYRQTRNEYFAEMLEDWTEADLVRFADELHRFGNAYAAMNDNWITERFGRGAGREGSPD